MIINANIFDIVGAFYCATSVQPTLNSMLNSAPTLNSTLNSSNSLLEEKSEKSGLQFLSSKKEMLRYWGNMMDLNSRGPLPPHTTIKCWNCRMNFDTQPYGIPIRYIQHPKNSLEEKKFEEWLRHYNYNPDLSCGYFETEGIVCSFECMKNYICEHNSSCVLYKDSANLMTMMYIILFNKLPTFHRASSWKAIDEWGGNLTKAEYRKNFEKKEILETINIKRPILFPVSRFLKENNFTLLH